MRSIYNCWLEHVRHALAGGFLFYIGAKTNAVKKNIRSVIFFRIIHLNSLLRYIITKREIFLRISPALFLKDVINMIKINLSRLLGERRMTQSELAIKTNIRPAAINEMYHELIERVNLDYLSRICEVLGCKIEDILEYVPDKDKKRCGKV